MRILANMKAKSSNHRFERESEFVILNHNLCDNPILVHITPTPSHELCIK